MGRFTLPGQIEVIWLTTAQAPASTSAPTAAELDAGISLVGTSQGEAMAEADGWQLNPGTIATPDYVSHKVGNVPGDETYPDSRIAIYKDDTSSTIYDAMVEGATGYIVWMRDGRGTGEETEVWPVTIQSRVRRPSRSEAHIFDVNFATAVPVQGTEAA